jgi:hypothetical protein
MIAYLKSLALRWARSRLGLEVLVAALGAPLFFTGAIFFLYSYGPYAVPSPDSSSDLAEGLFAGVIMLSILSATLSFTYLMTRTLHVEKLHNRATLLRTSGFDAIRAVLCFLAVSALLSVLLVPLSLIGAHLLHLIVGSPPITPAFVVVAIAMVTAMSPIVIGARLYFEQPVAFTVSCGAAMFGSGYIVGIVESGTLGRPLAYLLRIGGVWFLGAAVLLLLVSLHSHSKRRKGWT